VNGVTNQPMTLFNLDTAPPAPNILLTNISELDDNAYHGVEFDAVEHLSHKWLLLASFTIQRPKGVFCCAVLPTTPFLATTLTILTAISIDRTTSSTMTPRKYSRWTAVMTCPGNSSRALTSSTTRDSRSNLPKYFRVILSSISCRLPLS